MAMKLSEKQIQEGWQTVKFGEIAKEVKATTNDPVEDGLEFYVGLEHIDSQSLRLQRKGVISEDNTTFNKRFSPGHILFGRRRAYLKKAAVADFEGICSGDITVIEAVPGMIVPEFLPFIVQSDMFFDWAVKNSAGGLSPRVKWKSLAEFEFSLPPLDRQKEILKVLEKAEETELKYDSLKESIAKALFVALRDVFSKKPARYDQMNQVADVMAGKNSAIDKSLASGIKMVTLPCVNQHCEFSINDNNIAYIAPENVTEKDYLKKDDILFNWRNGSQKHVGKTAFIDKDMDYVHVGFFLRIKPKKSSICSKYLYWYLRYLKYCGFFSGAKQQVNRTFNKSELLELDVARYEAEKEEKIQSILEHIFAEQRTIDNYLKSYCVFRQKLVNAILQGGTNEL